MSIVGMARHELTRVGSRQRHVVQPDGTLVLLGEGEGSDSGGGGNAPPPSDNQVTNALSLLIKYIPTEAITLYVAAVSAAAALKLTFPFINEVRLYWFFGVVLTPALLILVYASQRKTAGYRPLPPLLDWPWWKMVSASIAFLVWALAIPNNPYIQGIGAGAVAGFCAIFVSTLLSYFEPFFE